jgi:hypothetical protein
MSTPTPRTDAQAGWAIANQYGQSTGSELLGDPNGVFVHAVFARTLERELTALTAERDRLRAALECMTPRYIELFEHCGLGPADDSIAVEMAREALGLPNNQDQP